jgi:hypothetical protein
MLQLQLTVPPAPQAPNGCSSPSMGLDVEAKAYWEDRPSDESVREKITEELETGIRWFAECHDTTADDTGYRKAYRCRWRDGVWSEWRELR